LDNVLMILQPQEAAFAVLHDALGRQFADRSAAWGEVETAIDWITETEAAARQLLQVFTRYRVNGATEDIRRGRCKHTFYDHQAPSSPVNGAWYCDKPGKITGSPCLHFEMRFTGIDACRKAGFKSARDFITFDPVAFWHKQLRFAVIDVEVAED